jgi:hypothetical protein
MSNGAKQSTHTQSIRQSFSFIEPGGVRTARKQVTRVNATPVTGRLISIDKQIDQPMRKIKAEMYLQNNHLQDAFSAKAPP